MHLIKFFQKSFPLVFLINVFQLLNILENLLLAETLTGQREPPTTVEIKFNSANKMSQDFTYSSHKSAGRRIHICDAYNVMHNNDYIVVV